MAHSAVSIRPSAIDKLNKRTPTHCRSLDTTGLALNLYFPPDTRGLRTQFRDSVINYIYRTALGLSVTA